jgi:hypothetical protein
MNRHLIFSVVASAGLAIGLVAGAGFASHSLNLSPVAGVTVAGADSAPKVHPSESPDPADSPEPAESPDPAETPEAGGSTAHPCNHGFYVSQAAHAHKGGAYVSSVAKSDLGKNGDCSAPLPKP